MVYIIYYESYHFLQTNSKEGHSLFCNFLKNPLVLSEMKSLGVLIGFQKFLPQPTKFGMIYPLKVL